MDFLGETMRLNDGMRSRPKQLSRRSAKIDRVISGEALERRIVLAPVLSLRGPTGPVIEGAAAEFSLTLSEPSSTPLSVFISTTPITASFGADYFLAPQPTQVVFTGNEIRKDFSIPTLRDQGWDKAEGVETFRVSARSAGAGTPSPKPVVVRIADYAEPGPAITIAPPSAGVREGDAATFTITLTKPPGSTPVRVSYATADGTAKAGTDYTATRGILTFSGNELVQTVAVPTTRDAFIDDSETFSVRLSSPVNGTLANTSATTTILNTTAPPPVISVTAVNTTVDEGAPASFSVSLSHVPAGTSPVSVFYATKNGTAFAGIDYTAASGTLVFTGQELTKTITISTLADRVTEQTAETFSLQLSLPTAATIGTGLATVSITEPVSPIVAPPPAGTFSPQQIKSAYNLTTAGDGTGTTIAIVVAGSSPTIRQDLNAFNQAFNLPFPPSLTIVNQAGGLSLPAAVGQWPVEIALDVQWAHAIAPGAGILLVCANSASTTDLFAAVDYARGVPGVSVVSMSFGFDEFTLTAAQVQALDTVLTTPAGRQGVTFVAAAGDTGQVAYPASSANVLAVGGTQLTLTGTGGYGSEVVWNAFLTSGLATGGGPSLYVPKPAFQNGFNTGPNNTTGATRGVPDVAFSATNIPIFTAGEWQTVSGTSFSAPAWAGIVAIANGRRLASGRETLRGTQAAVYGMPKRNFRDITVGNNGAYPALSGYDLASGRGSPIGSLVVASLVSYSNPAASTSLAPRTAPAVGTASASVAIAKAFASPAVADDIGAEVDWSMLGRASRRRLGNFLISVRT